jgi:hypothetical protein
MSVIYHCQNALEPSYFSVFLMECCCVEVNTHAVYLKYPHFEFHLKESH